MWTNSGRGFSTPPPSWKSRPFRSPKTAPFLERKRSSPNSANKSDLFHVIHKIPAGDSPYVKAKQVQLIDKDPSRAVSLFWAAINAGDRVDSALKDMAVVMKQLDRSDEAIEAIRSFRHICPYDSQESIDNVLIELYKRSGRIEEEIDMLRCKLRQIEEGTVFGGKRTKAARSQGKKVQITVEQEKSRVLGNLAWAFLQQDNINVAEEYYRKALSLEPDNNKKCNLAICLILTNRLTEAKSLLRSIRASSGGKPMEESYAKSFERASHVLAEKESKLFNSRGQEEEGNRTVTGITSKSTSVRAQPCVPQITASTRWTHDEDVGFNCCSLYSSPTLAKRNIEVPFTQPKNSGRRQRKKSSSSSRKVLFENPSMKDQSFDDNGFAVDASSESEGSGPTSNYKTKYRSAVELEVPFTQPRSCSWGINGGGRRRKATECFKGLLSNSSSRELSFEPPTSTENIQALTDSRFGRSELSRAVSAEPQDLDADWQKTCYGDVEYEEGAMAYESTKIQEEEHITVDQKLKHNSSTTGGKKSWADMVEEEEEEDGDDEKEDDTEETTSSSGRRWGSSSSDNEELKFNDENLNSNILHQKEIHSPSSNQVEDILKLASLDIDIKDGAKASGDVVLSRNPAVRRPLCFDRQPTVDSADNRRSWPAARKDLRTEVCCNAGQESSSSSSIARRNRLQVFQEITVHQELES